MVVGSREEARDKCYGHDLRSFWFRNGMALYKGSGHV